MDDEVKRIEDLIAEVERQNLATLYSEFVPAVGEFIRATGDYMEELTHRLGDIEIRLRALEEATGLDKPPTDDE